MKERKIECVREREREKKCVSETASFEERGGERMRVRERGDIFRTQVEKCSQETKERRTVFE